MAVSSMGCATHGPNLPGTGMITRRGSSGNRIRIQTLKHTIHRLIGQMRYTASSRPPFPLSSQSCHPSPSSLSPRHGTMCRSTGCGLPSGPFGLYGAAEGISYLWVVGLVGYSIYTKATTGKVGHQTGV